MTTPHITRIVITRIVYMYAFFALGLAALSWLFMVTPRSPSLSPFWLVAYAALAVFMVITIIRFRNYKIWLFASIVFLGFASLTILFSFAYWQYGQPGAFNIQLSHLDAIYFTLGTLSTAGTGNIVAISETARAIQSIQMSANFGLTLLAAGLLVSRLSVSAE
jgi:voltage-gated potassium channel